MGRKDQQKKTFVKTSKMTAGEKKKRAIANKAKANPKDAAKNKEKKDKKRARRAASGSVKKLG